jgi:hypothetical protein
VPRTYSDRVLKFRRGVYRHPTIPAGCKLLLIRLSDSMSADAKVSVPRSTLAADLDVAPARISEWVKQARTAGFLDVVRRARPGVTAVYQGLFVGTDSVPNRGTDFLTSLGTETGPPNRTQRYGNHPPQEVQTQPSDQTGVVHLIQRGSEGATA